MTFEEWWKTFKPTWPKPAKSDMQAAYNAGRADEKFAANNRAGDSGNEAEKVERLSLSVERIVSAYEHGDSTSESFRAFVTARIKEAQG